MKGPLFKWFGSKWMASKYYPKPQFRTIFEPFTGSGGYSSRYADHNVIIIENNLLLLELWAWLIDYAYRDDILSIPLNLKEGTDIRTLELSRGQQLLLKHWQRTNNYGDCWTISPWGNKPGQWTESTRSRIAEEIYEIKHWQLIASMSIPQRLHYQLKWLRENCEPATWFLDPPYQYNYRYGSTYFDYENNIIQLIKKVIYPNSQIIVCEARCPKTDKIPDYLPFKDFRRCVTSRRGNGNHTHSREVMWYQEGKII